MEAPSGHFISKQQLILANRENEGADWEAVGQLPEFKVKPPLRWEAGTGNLPALQTAPQRGISNSCLPFFERLCSKLQFLRQRVRV
jgi:hypothetical protein